MRYILWKIEPSAITAAISADTAATADDLFAAAATVTSELIGVQFFTATWSTLRPLWNELAGPPRNRFSRLAPAAL
jgi:hypothetical protein